MRPASFLFALVFSAVSFLISNARADTVLHYFSEPGDDIGQGEERSLTPAGGYAFQASSMGNHVEFYVRGPETWSVTFAVPEGHKLAVGDYSSATQYPLEGAIHPGLNFDGDGRSSNFLFGQFKILEVTFDAAGKLSTFAANFVQHSRGAVPASFGELRYNSSIPYASPGGFAVLGTFAYSALETAGSLTVSVKRLEGSAGPLTVDYATKDGTDLAGRDYVPTAGMLTWADGDTSDKSITIPILDSGDPTQGNGNFLIGLSGAAAGAQSQANVVVVNDNSSVTYVHFISDPGDYIGQGQERLFNSADGYKLVPKRVASNSVWFRFDNDAATDLQDAQFWDLDFNGPTGSSFGVGDYTITSGLVFPGLSLTGDGRDNGTVTGNFQVREAVFDNNGNVLRFAADFEQHSDGDSPGLYGEVRYNSTVPATVRVQAVSVVATAPEAHEKDSVRGVFKLSRAGGTAAPLTVVFKLVGSAVNGYDYKELQTTRTFAVGQSSLRVKVRPIDLGATSGTRVVKLKLLAPDGTYTVTDSKIAKVKILRDDPVYTGPNPD